MELESQVSGARPRRAYNRPSIHSHIHLCTVRTFERPKSWDDRHLNKLDQTMWYFFLHSRITSQSV